MALLLTAPTYATQIDDLSEESFDDPQIRAVMTASPLNFSQTAVSRSAPSLPTLNRRLTSKGELAEPDAYTRGLHARLNLLSATIKQPTSEDEDSVGSVTINRVFQSPDGKSSLQVEETVSRKEENGFISTSASSSFTGEFNGTGSPFMAASLIQQLMSPSNTIDMVTRTIARDGSVHTTSKKITPPSTKASPPTLSSLESILQQSIDPAMRSTSAAAKSSTQTTAQPKSTGQQPASASQLKSKKAAATVTGQQPASSSSAKPKTPTLGSTSISDAQLETIFLDSFLDSSDKTTGVLDIKQFIGSVSNQLAAATQNPNAKADDIARLIDEAGRAAWSQSSGLDMQAFAKDMLSKFARYRAQLSSAQSSSSSAQPKTLGSTASKTVGAGATQSKPVAKKPTIGGLDAFLTKSVDSKMIAKSTKTAAQTATSSQPNATASSSAANSVATALVTKSAPTVIKKPEAPTINQLDAFLFQGIDPALIKRK